MVVSTDFSEQLLGCDLNIGMSIVDLTLPEDAILTWMAAGARFLIL